VVPAADSCCAVLKYSHIASADHILDIFRSKENDGWSRFDEILFSHYLYTIDQLQFLKMYELFY
jgi:hypothetical protein